MSDNVFSAVLTFSLLAGGTIAFGSEMLASRHVAAKATAVATLPRVVVTGSRGAHTALAAETTAAERRVLR